MTYAAFSQPWPSGPPAFSFDESATAQFGWFGFGKGDAPKKPAPSSKHPMRLRAESVPPPRPFFPAKVPEQTSHEYKTPYGRTQAHKDEEFKPHGRRRRRRRMPEGEPSQFTAYEDYYQEYEPTEHDDEQYEREPGIYELAKHLGASDEEAEHLERLYLENQGKQEKSEQGELGAPRPMYPFLNAGNLPHSPLSNAASPFIPPHDR